MSARFWVLIILILATPVLALVEEISSTVEVEIESFVAVHLNGTHSLDRIEATFLHRQGRKISGYNIQTIAMADTNSGQFLSISYDGEEWEIWQAFTWVGVPVHGNLQRVFVSDSVSVEVSRDLLGLVVPELKINEQPSQVGKIRLRRTNPKYGSDPRTYTHEIRTVFDAPNCYEGRIFQATATGDTLEITGVTTWVF